MIEPRKKIRQTLFSIHPLSYRIKESQPPKEFMDKKLFVEVLETLRKIEDRRDFMQEEIGMDMTLYEDQFFLVIENLLKIHYNKAQLALIQMYLYQLKDEDKDWDGTITIEVGNKKEETLNFKTPNDVWEALKKVE